MLQNIVKMTATCWTRCIYCYPPLASQTWDYWYSQLSEGLQRDLPVTLPKDWRKQPLLANTIVRACPFCDEKQAGTLEHLHLYCMSAYMVDARAHCNGKIESALHELYDFASQQEFYASFHQSLKQTKLQENMEKAAHQTELVECLVFKDSKVYLEVRPANIAILS
jgi:hypothetical protein